MTTPLEQLELWVAGNSVCKGYKECCPDFSCCRPHLQWSTEKRQAFMQATQKERNFMLADSLAALVADANPKNEVHVTGRKKTR